jgi:hypothetical protein
VTEKILIDKTGQRPGAAQPEDFYTDSTVKLPKELDPKLFGATAFFGKIDEDGDLVLDTEKMKGITFDRVHGRPLAREKRGKVMKAFKPDGTLIQLPTEKQINNAAAGRPGDMIGLLPHIDKGFMMCWDDNRYPHYCSATDCWAPAMRGSLKTKQKEHVDAIGTGFCSVYHQDHTQPNRAGGPFSQNVTTTSVWNA